MKNIFSIFCIAVAMMGLASCGNEDDFTESIFDTETPAVDTTLHTAPFDQWLFENFVEPYNTRIDYRFNFPASQMTFQLTPADYKKSQLLAHFIKYLFYDVYNKYGEKDSKGNEVFMKKYGPRLFHFIGSAAYSPTTGTETQGYASGGVKITLINVNNMRPWEPGTTYTEKDVLQLNKDQFHVMHHEFSHIMHQTKSYPVAFGQVTPGSYDGRSWQDRDSTLSHQLGFVTQYGSSANTEDFVEFLSCAITDTDGRWMTCLVDACLNGGVKEGDKERLYTFIDSLGINIDDPKFANAPWNKFAIYKEEEQNSDTKQWEETGRYVAEFHVSDAKSQAAGAYPARSLRHKTLVTKITSFRQFVDSWVQYDTEAETRGLNAILKKYEIATKWYTENWGLYLFSMRQEVRERQDNINEYLNSGKVVIYD